MARRQGTGDIVNKIYKHQRDHTISAFPTNLTTSCVSGTVEGLDFSGCDFTPSAFNQLCALLGRSDCKVTRLVLSNTTFLSPERLKILTDSLIRNKKTKLKSVSFLNAQFNDQHCVHVAKLIAENTSLKEINLNDNKITLRGQSIIDKAFETNFYLEEIFMNGMPALDFSDRKIFNFIARNKANNDMKAIFSDTLTEEKAVRWGRSKLMVIGQGGAGKTSTVRALLGKEFNEKWDSTIGADLKKTDTSNWVEQDVQTSNFNEAAAAVILESQAKQGELFQARMNAFKQRDVIVKDDDEEEKEEEEKEEVKEEPEVPAAERIEAPDDEAEPRNQNQPERLAANPGGQPQGPERAYDIDQEVEINDELFRRERRKMVDETDVARRYGQKLLAQAAANKDASDPDKIVFTIWDYGGQDVFYTLHHLFLTKYGVYLIVFDMTELVKFTASYPNLFEVNPEAVRYLSFWVNSVILHAPDAPVLLVGTHMDSVLSEIQKYNKKLQQARKKPNIFNLFKRNANIAVDPEADVVPPTLDDFLEKINATLVEEVKVKRNPNLVLHGEKVFFATDNRQNLGIPDLRKSIETCAKGKAYLETKIPLRWVLVCDCLLEDEQFKAPYKTFEEVVTLAAKFGCKRQEIPIMLKLMAELGVLVYLSSTITLQDRVITEPQWLIDKLGGLIRDEMHGAHENLQGKLAKEFKKMHKTGVVSRLILEVMWKCDTLEKTEKDVVFLLDLMKNTMLLSDWNYIGDADETYYLVPSLLRHSHETHPEFKTLLGSFFHENAKCRVAVLDFSEFFLPTGVFQRMICYLANLMSARMDTLTHGMPLKDKKRRLKEITPLLGKDMVFVQFPFLTEEKITLVKVFMIEKDGNKIELNVEDERYASDFLTLVTALVTKMRVETMGSRLKHQVLVSKTKSSVQQKYEEIGMMDLQEAKKDQSGDYKCWFLDEVEAEKKAEEIVNFDGFEEL